MQKQRRYLSFWYKEYSEFEASIHYRDKVTTNIPAPIHNETLGKRIWIQMEMFNTKKECCGIEKQFYDLFQIRCDYDDGLNFARNWNSFDGTIYEKNWLKDPI